MSRLFPAEGLSGLKRFSLVAVLLLLTHFSRAAKVDTVDTYSAAMHKTIKAVVVTPDDYAAGRAFPVVYMLHGYGGNYSDFIKNIPSIKTDVDRYHFIIVCADGRRNSWYFDSPVDSASRYETYVSKELVDWIDAHYKTIRDRSGRAIMGLSMGGHGALYLSFRHQDVFGAAGSMSGGVDFRPFPKNWDISAQLGAYSEHPENWDANTVINLTHLLKPDGSLALIIDDGYDDFFYKVNLDLHNKLLEEKIPHDFIIRPGGHSWTYWSNSVPYQLLFFSRFFAKAG
jgi:S-formylglutathione hydrolase FrmB